MSAEIAAGGLPARLPVRTKVAYGLGTLAFGIKDHGFGALLMLYYNQVIGLPASWVGTMIMLAMVVDAVVDPLIGHWSDNFVSPLGRRHPFMYASAIPVALSYLLLWAPPKADPAWQCAWLLATAIAVRVSVSFFEIPNAALTTEFTADYEERTSLSTYRGVFLAIAMGVMAIVTFKYFLRPTADGRPGQLNPAGYAAYSRFAAALMFLSVLVSSWGTQDRGRALVPHRAADRQGGHGFLRNLRQVLLDGTYASMLGANFFFALAVGISGTLGVYLLTYYWRATADQIGIVTGSSVLSLLFGVLIVSLTRRYDKKPVALILLAGTVVSCILLISLGLLGLAPADTARMLPWLVLQNIVAISCILALTILVASMVGDVGDYFRLKTGSHIEGLMFSTLVMINKSVSGFGVFIAGAILALVHFPEKAQPGEIGQPIILSLGWVYVAGIVVLCLLSLLCLRAFPLTRASHREILDRLGRQGTG
jgi:Na+/melibiose symporter-like transporter